MPGLWWHWRWVPCQRSKRKGGPNPTARRSAHPLGPISVPYTGILRYRVDFLALNAEDDFDDIEDYM